jgi:hypothetical protein
MDDYKIEGTLAGAKVVLRNTMHGISYREHSVTVDGQRVIDESYRF